jgi:large subunit ribosomal protein L21
MMKWSGSVMYAVIVSGGKQYRVKAGQSVKLEKLAVDADTKIKFDKILMVSNGDETLVGAPYLSGYTVNAEVVKEGRGEKIRIVKFRRRKHHMKTMGHRQSYTEVKITGIEAA